VLALLLRVDLQTGAELAFAQCRDARGMTDRLSALAALVRFNAPQAGEALRLYRARFNDDTLALNKWFALQAQTPAHDTLDRVQALEDDPAFTLANPNRVQALIGTFARANPVGFNRPDGAGYHYYVDKLANIDARNPQLAARLAKAFEDWPRLEPGRRQLAHDVLRQLAARSGTSRNLGDILMRMLAAGDS
jgi:aminopeptidase N